MDTTLQATTDMGGGARDPRMSDVWAIGYVLGYDAGRSPPKSRASDREIVDAVFYGQRLVQVDQSYLDQLDVRSLKSSDPSRITI